MNGATVPFLVWVVNGLLGLVILLLGVIVRMHQQSDEDHRKRMDREINMLRNRIHDWSSNIGWIESERQKERR
jgi:uncharacterized membrane protein